MAIEDQIKEIEEEIRDTPYNKASQHHIGKLKAKLAKLKQDQQKGASVGHAQSLGYGLRKYGDATVLFAGFPSVGKSTLLNALTNAKSEVAAYEFTTLTVVPGVMKYKHSNLQLFDIPGLVEGASQGKGRGREVLSVMRIADLIIFVFDANKPEQLNKMRHELDEANIRLDQAPPQVVIKKKTIGGVQVDKVSKAGIDNEAIRDVLNEFGIHNAYVSIKEPITIDQFIDVVTGNRKYVPTLAVMNKIDSVKKLPSVGNCVKISALNGEGLDELREAIFQKLRFIRIYLKRHGKKADLEEPLIMKEGCTVEDVCLRLHKSFRDNFRYAELNGPSAKFDNQKVHLRHVLKDKDIICIFKKD
ncbi:MAG: GTP-binding protein [archaeon]